MRNRLLYLLPFLAGPAWNWLWEFIRSLFYERGSRMLIPFFDSVTMDDLFRWGPTIGFPALGLYLFWKTQPPGQGFLERRLSSQKPSVIELIEWKKPFDAIESFGNQTLVASKNKWKKTFADAQESLYETAKKLDELERNERNERKDDGLANLAANTFPYQESSALANQRRRQQVAIIGERIAKDELPRSWAALREDIGDKLESGELAAKGVPAPYIAGKGETEIAPHEWRLLTIDPVREHAIEKNDGEVKYVGLVIGKRPVP